MNMFLVFFDKNLEKKYIQWKAPSTRVQVRIISFLTAILYLLYYQTDRLIGPPEALSVMKIFHLYLLPCLAIIISVLSFKKEHYNKMIYLLVFAPIVASVGNYLIVTKFEGFTIYSFEIYLIILWAFTISGLRLFHSLFSAFFVISISTYVFYSLPHEIYIMHCYFMLASVSFGLVSSYMLERLHKNIFLNEEQLKALANTDLLTGLYNRKKLDEVVANEILRCERFGHSFGFIMMDIDHFKNVNDKFGHHTGDIFLKGITEIFKQNMRSTDVLIRWGGEEFVIICLETDINGVLMLVENIRQKVQEHVFDKVGSKTISMGVCMYEKGDSTLSLIKKSDEALYRAKDNGRNRVEVY